MRARLAGMDRERRFLGGECELRASGSSLKIVGYAAVYNELSENLGGFYEKIAPSAFRKTLKEADIRGLFNHRDDAVLGRNRAGTMRLRSDSRGLEYEIDVNDKDPDHQRVIAKLERGDVSGSSFGFRTVSDKWENLTAEDDSDVIRTLLEVRLFDVGPVTFPAYPATDAGMALRSLATVTGASLDELAAAAARDDLRSILTAGGTDADDVDDVVTSAVTLHEQRRRRLDLLARRAV